MNYKTHTANKTTFIEAINSDDLKVIVCPVGASIMSISFKGETLTIAPSTGVEFMDPKYINGKTLGPTLNEVININNKEYTLNKKYVCKNFLFTTKPLVDPRIFSCLYSFSKKKFADNLPGNITYFISISMNDISNEILIDYRVMSDDSTPINISNGLCFALDNPNLLEGINKIEGPIYIENDNYRIDIVPTGYQYLKVNRFENEFQKGTYISPIDKEDTIIKKGDVYHRQILYKFSKK